MDEFDVRIEELESVRVASVYGFGNEPETIAWNKLIAYAQRKGWLDDPENHKIFGFNNPDPSAGSPNYGYELWIEVGPSEEPEDDIRIIDFRGGLYAVTRCEVRNQNYDQIGILWKQLVTWREDSQYGQGYHQWLERTIPNGGLAEGDFSDFTLDLYLPISR